MSLIKENKKFKRKKEQKLVTNPSGNIERLKNREFELNQQTIKEQQTKH
nr:hypothetical protein [uncultured Polaribacter sp.]